MEGPSGSETPPVTLIIKTPNQRYGDQTIRCPDQWSVGRLKAHLADVYPGKPRTKDQRLVYSGRLLPDHLQLKDILRKQDDYHMVHLVCASRSPPSSPQSNSRRGSEEALTSISSFSSDNSGSSTPSSSQESLTATASSGSEGPRYRNSPQAPANPEQSLQIPYVVQGNVGNQFPGQALPAAFPVYPAFSPLQMLWWQQMYARQYYMQYQAAVSAQATSNTDPSRPAAAQVPNLAHVPAHEPQPGPNAGAQENRALNPNVQMNAQGGPVINEDDLNRDWLDWMYTFSRAAILLSIVYFYSSFSRFVMVMGAMLLVYLHQAGWLPFRQEGGQLQAPNNAGVNHDGQDGNNPDLEEMGEKRTLNETKGLPAPPRSGAEPPGGRKSKHKREEEPENTNSQARGRNEEPWLLGSLWNHVLRHRGHPRSPAGRGGKRTPERRGRGKPHRSWGHK